MDFEGRYRVRPGKLRLDDLDPADTAKLTKDDAAGLRERDLARLAELQERLYAESARSLLVVFQALDAAGKDGTITHVLSGLHPQGVQVTAFRVPSELERAHDFLWRCQLALPRRGRIGIFNRSHYEEVLVVRVHPELLAGQRIDPARASDERFWQKRYEAISTWERHLARDGTRVVKLFLNVSREEQRRRFLDRVEEPDKLWKFSAADVRERRHWGAYRAAYEQALAATSTEEAPWYAIPADHKWLARTAVASILVHHLEAMDPRYPEPGPGEREAMDEAVAELRAESA
ncbi:MAG: hypothetical protein LT070_04720 [Solirubrobacteraceae bacterium]|nr:hypothetical protein [Solirubrobacteraceae bacterium]